MERRGARGRERGSEQGVYRILKVGGGRGAMGVIR